MGFLKFILFVLSSQLGQVGGDVSPEEPTPDPVEPTEPEGGASMEELNKYKEDMFRYKREAKSAAEERQKLQAELEKVQTDQMKQKNQYKELYEQASNKAQEVEQKYSRLQESLVINEKLKAIERAALKHGIRENALEDLSMLNTDDVIVETTSTGRVNVVGADEFVSKLKSVKSHWFAKSAPNINNSTGTFQSEESGYTPNQLLDIQKKDPAKYREILLKKQHLIRRS